MAHELLEKTLNERYRFEELLGEGSFANVYRVTDLSRQKVLAAKVLRNEFAREATLLERFEREAAVLSQLQHPNIVRFYGIEDSPASDSDQPGYLFILTEFVPGETLEDWFQRQTRPLKPLKSIQYLTPMAAALHHAHAQNIVHRDLKPANILLHDDGTVLVTDFGLARVLNHASTLTVGMSVGTPYYMSPEQITGETVTFATDVYAFGVIMYRLFTGQLPFTGDSPESKGGTPTARITYEHVHAPPRSLRELNPGLGLAVEEVVLQCLKKQPQSRFDSIGQVYDALTEAVGAPPVALATTANPVHSTENNHPDIKLPEWSQFVRPVNIDDHDTTGDVVPPESDAFVRHPNNDAPQQTGVGRPRSPIRPEQTLQAPANRIEHPAPQPVTQTNLRRSTHGPAPGGTSTNRTMPTTESFAHAATDPLASASTAPPGYLTPHIPVVQGHRSLRHAQARRNWFQLVIIAGFGLISVTLCLAVTYLVLASNLLGDSTDSDSAPPMSEIETNSTQPEIQSADATSPTEVPVRFAFDSRRSGSLDIYIMHLDGSNLQQVTSLPGAERGPAWSPTADQIAFYGAASENEQHDIYIINADGTHLRNITNTPTVDERYPAWSPDGTQLAFHSNQDGDYDLYIMRPDGSDRRAVTKNTADDLGPDWSPDGTQIAFHTDVWGAPYELAILDLATGNVRRVTNNNRTNSFPSWSPDGSQLAFNAIDPFSVNAVNIFIINTDGTNIRQLTNTPDNNAFPDWSPDGVHILYQNGTDTTSAIYRIALPNGQPDPLTGRQANFLPDWEPIR